MKQERTIQMKFCKSCGRAYGGVPAISRVDNKTCICQDCGTREALESLGIDELEQEKILATIHKYSS